MDLSTAAAALQASAAKASADNTVAPDAPTTTNNMTPTTNNHDTIDNPNPNMHTTPTPTTDNAAIAATIAAPITTTEGKSTTTHHDTSALAAFFAPPIDQITIAPPNANNNNSHLMPYTPNPQNLLSPTTTQTAPIIDLSTIDETTRAQILSLINPTATPSPMPITTTPSRTYASMVTDPTAKTNNTNATTPMQPTIHLPPDYNHDPTDITINDNTDDDNNNPFILVTTKKQNKSKQQTTTTSPTKDGISGVKAASTLLWNDKAAAEIMNADDLDRQTIHFLEGRVPNVNSVKRPVVWLKFWFPTDLPNTTTPPNILQQELAINHIISNVSLDFIVDRVYIGTLMNPIHINDTLCFLGFAALSPRTTNTTSNTLDKITLQNLYILEDRLHIITSNKINYQANNTTIPLLNHILFKLPHLNNYTEETTFLIKGLHQGIPNNDVATLRELATEIFRAIHSSYHTRYPNAKPPAVLQRHTSRFSINQIMSIRSWNITPTKQQKPSQSPPRNTSNNTPDRALIIVLDPHSQAASDLEHIIISLSNDHNSKLSICGGKIDINLIHFNDVPNPTPALGIITNSTNTYDKATSNTMRAQMYVLSETSQFTHAHYPTPTT